MKRKKKADLAHIYTCNIFSCNLILGMHAFMFLYSEIMHTVVKDTPFCFLFLLFGEPEDFHTHPHRPVPLVMEYAQRLCLEPCPPCL